MESALPFPITINGSISFAIPDDLSPDRAKRLMNDVQRLLWTARALSVVVKDREVRFTGGVFRLVSGWNILAPVGWGSIAVDEQSRAVVVRYHLNMLEMLLVTSGMVTFLGLGVWGAQNLDTISKVEIIGGAWLWLFGANYLLSIFRFPIWLRNGLEQTTAPENEEPSRSVAPL